MDMDKRIIVNFDVRSESLEDVPFCPDCLLPARRNGKCPDCQKVLAPAESHTEGAAR